MSQSVFLSARWKYLLMANYAIDPSVLAPLVPAGCKLDFYEGKTYVSVVGFLFEDVRLKGLPIPFHTFFEEVNLRFYVVYDNGRQRKRGVVFVREIVPKPIVAWVANVIYNENYAAVPMKHDIRLPKAPGDCLQVNYQWRWKGRWQTFAAKANPRPKPIIDGTFTEFITEHYWGYAQVNQRHTMEYAVEHPRWNAFEVQDFTLDLDVASVYGPAYTPYIQGTPASVFLADGSDVIVRDGVKLTD